MQAITGTGMSLADYMRRYDEEGPFELIGGQVIPMSPTKFGHSYLTRLLFRAFDSFVGESGEWEVFTETPFIQPGAEDPNWVEGSLVPDVLLLRAEKLLSYIATAPDWRDKPLAVVPDLVVEIISPTDRYSDVVAKIERYFALGVQVVWLMDPQRHKVIVHEGSLQQQTVLNESDTLVGGTLLPGFSLAVKSHFS
jgi:Uma2 family endonuclease